MTILELCESVLASLSPDLQCPIKITLRNHACAVRAFKIYFSEENF